MLKPIFSAGLSSLEAVHPAEELDEDNFPLYARPRFSATLSPSPRVVRVGTTAFDLDDSRVVVLRLWIDNNSSCWVVVRNVDGQEVVLPLSSLRLSSRMP